MKLTPAQHNELWQLVVDPAAGREDEIREQEPERLRLIAALKNGRTVDSSVYSVLRQWAEDMTTFDESPTPLLGKNILRKLDRIEGR